MRGAWLLGLLLALNPCAFAVDSKKEAEFEYAVLGYSSELNAVFAVQFTAPDDGKCLSYVIDLDKKVRYRLAAQSEVAKAVVAAGEGDELSSCALRAFDAPLELKLKTKKNAAPEEKQKLEAYLSATTNAPISGFKDRSMESLGAWLHKERTAWSEAHVAALYDLGATEVKDGHWLDAYDALVIAGDMKPGFATKEGMALAREVIDKASTEKSSKAILMWEVAARLEPKSVRALLGLAACPEVAPTRALQLLRSALKMDPVLTTRIYREESMFKALRCEPKFSSVRSKLPASLIQDVSC